MDRACASLLSRVLEVNLISIYFKTSRNWVTWLSRYKKLSIGTKLCRLRVRSFAGPCELRAKHLSERGRRGVKKSRKWQWEKKRRERKGRSSARWLYRMSRLCLASVRNVIHTPLAFRHVPFRSRLRLLLRREMRSSAASSAPPLTKLRGDDHLSHLRASRRRVVSQLRPVKYRAAKV